MDIGIQITGLLIAVAALAQLVLTLRMSLYQYRVRRRMLHQYIEYSQQTFETHIFNQEQIREQAGLAWNGYRKFQVDRKVYEDKNGNICSFYLLPHDGKGLPTFKAGQFLTLRVDTVTAAERRGGVSLVRCYSLSDFSRNPNYYRITVKRLTPPLADHEVLPGRASNHLHDNISQGDILDFEAPRGKFYLDLASQAPVVLVGGGIGVTPVLSMLNAIAETDSKREVWFFYGIRDSTEIIMSDHLEKLSREKENVHLHICYSNPQEDEIRESNKHRGHISVDLLKRLLPYNNYRFYVCGPSAMMRSITQDLNIWGVPDEHVFMEAFGPAAVKPVSMDESKEATSDITVTFSKSGETYPWEFDAASILDFAEAKGHPIDAGCRIGNCNTCMTAVKEGKVRYLHDPDTMPNEGSCLTCISVPEGRIVLDV